METTNVTKQVKNTTESSPKLPRKVVRLSGLKDADKIEASVLDVKNAGSQLSLDEHIVWVSSYEEFSTIRQDGDSLSNYDKQINKITEGNGDVIVNQVKIFTVAGNSNLDNGNMMIVGVAGDEYYTKWSNTGKFPYSLYCSDENPGKLKLNTVYGIEGYDTLRLIAAKEQPTSTEKQQDTDSVLINLYTRYNSNIVITAQSAFSADEKIYEFPSSILAYSDTDFIVDINVLIDGGIKFGQNSRLILEGGNLYKWYSLNDFPKQVICNNGRIISVNSNMVKTSSIAGPANSIFRHSQTGNVIIPKRNQGLYLYEINVLDFIDTTTFIKTTETAEGEVREEVGVDYNAIFSATGLNATNILKRVFDAVYEQNDPNGNRFVIRFPENQYGGSYYLTEPLVIPQGVIVDFGGATLRVGVKGESVDHDETVFNPGESKSIISFGYNPVYPILSTGQIRNVNIQLHNIARKQVDKVIDLTYFSGVLENVRINLGGATNIVALWQPFGNPWITYSDQKIIRRCIIENFGWRVDTPTAIFCLGDGCIIEQSILGFLAIIGGNSYTIRGCLNDKYLICDSSVDFTASYWEAGQFEILNSEVSFGCGRLHASNRLNGTKYQNKYLGPWFSIDTKESYQRLNTIFNNQHLNGLNYMEFMKKNPENKVQARIYERASTVEFKPTMKVQTVFWGYTQPWSGPLFKIEGHPRIIGLENVASVGESYLNGWDVPTGTNKIGIDSTLAASIPLVNGDFYDWRTSIKVPGDVTFDVFAATPWLSDGEVDEMMVKRAGLEWETSQTLTEIKAVFELDRKRNLYSRVFECGNNVDFDFRTMPTVKVNVTYQRDEDAPRNLKTILLFRCQTADGVRMYMARNHFKEVSHASLVNVGDREIEFHDRKMVDVGEFSFIRNIGFTDEFEVTENDGNKYLIAGIEYDKDQLQAYFNNHRPEVTCESGQDIDVPDCDGLCYGHAYFCDNKGNLVPEVKECLFTYHGVRNYNVCTRMEVINDMNVRAYVEEVPLTGEWADGDEVVIDSAQEVYRYYSDTWHRIVGSQTI